LHHAGLIAKSLDARNKELRKKMGESEQYRLIAKQLEMEATHTNLLVQRLKSDKASLNSALINAQETLQRVQHENDKLSTHLKLEEGVTSLVRICLLFLIFLGRMMLHLARSMHSR
jgi:hypothetical protein